MINCAVLYVSNDSAYCREKRYFCLPVGFVSTFFSFSNYLNSYIYCSTNNINFVVDPVQMPVATIQLLVLTKR